MSFFPPLFNIGKKASYLGFRYEVVWRGGVGGTTAALALAPVVPAACVAVPVLCAAHSSPRDYSAHRPKGQHRVGTACGMQTGPSGVHSTGSLGHKLHVAPWTEPLCEWATCTPCWPQGTVQPVHSEWVGPGAKGLVPDESDTSVLHYILTVQICQFLIGIRYFLHI